MRGRDAGLFLALDAGDGTTIGGVLVDRAPDRLPNDLEFGLDESDDGGLS